MSVVGRSGESGVMRSQVVVYIGIGGLLEMDGCIFVSVLRLAV